MHSLVPTPRRRPAQAVAALLLGALVALVAPLAPAHALEPVAGHIVVTVTDERTDALLPGAEVALYPAAWDRVSAPVATATTDGEGAADLDGTLLDPAGPYTIRVTATGYDSRWAADARDLAGATTYTFDPALGQAVAVELPQLKGAVTGTVVAAETGSLIHGAVVCLDDATTEAVDPGACRWTNGEGAFTVPVPAGSYLVRVTAWDRTPFVASAPLTVGLGETVVAGEVALELLPELVPTAPAAVSTATPTVGSAVTVTLPTFAEAGVTTAVAWFVGDRHKPVAVGTTFVPKKQYAGKALSAVLVSAVSGYRVRTEEVAVGVVVAPVVPAGKPGKHAPAPVAPAPVAPAPAPVVQGPAPAATAKVGKVAKVKAPVVEAGATVTYQWLANGKPVRQTAKPTYKVGPKLRSKAIAVRVVVTKPGHAPYVKVVRLGKAR